MRSPGREYSSQISRRIRGAPRKHRDHATRIRKALARLGAVEVMPDTLAVDDAWAARDPVMAHLAAAAVAGLPPAGFAERKRDPVTVMDGARPHIVGDLVVQDRGFNLHAKTRAGALDEPARARLLRYVLRPPLARERLQRHQGLSSPPHEPAPARAPPYQRAVTRLHPSRQEELSFDT